MFQEGLRLPAVKIVNEGVTDQAVVDIITCNSRMPDFLKGDVWSAIASVRVGTQRLEGLAEKYGTDIFLRAIDTFMEFGETAARAELAKLPKGSFELSEEQDDGQVFNLKVTISDDAFVVDFRDNPDQTAGPRNATRDGTVICAQMVFKALTGPDTPANEGSFRPLNVLTREGSIFHASEPAAIGFYYETEIRSNDLIWRCLAPHIPDLLPAGHFSSICGTFIAGIHPDTGRQYTIIEPQLGGWGAGHDHDGISCNFCNFHGEPYNTPAEISEARNGLYVDRMALNEAPGGEGQFTGGRGLILEYRIRAEQGFLTMGYTRSKVKPWGMEGGLEGSGNYVDVINKDGTETYSFVSGLPLTTDDVVRVVTSSGAGFGDPKKRDRAAEIYGD